MRATGAILILGLLTRAFSAPIDIDVDKKGGPRVSTKEIINLEQQLKAQAGEDKKFYPSEMQKQFKQVPPQQQVDGLEDPETDANSGYPQSEEQLTQPEDKVSMEEQLDQAQQDELAAAKRREQLFGDDDDSERAVLHDAARSTFTGDIRKENEDGKGVMNEPEVSENEIEEDGQEEDGEALFMQSVIEALRDRPELLQEFLQAGRLSNNDVIEDSLPGNSDEADRADVIRAEYLEAMGANRGRAWGRGDYVPSELLQDEQLVQSSRGGLPSGFGAKAADQMEQERQLAEQRQAVLESLQDYHGDDGARVVKKSYMNVFPGKEKKNHDGEQSYDEENDNRADLTKHIAM